MYLLGLQTISRHIFFLMLVLQFFDVVYSFQIISHDHQVDEKIFRKHKLEAKWDFDCDTEVMLILMRELMPC